MVDDHPTAPTANRVSAPTTDPTTDPGPLLRSRRLPLLLALVGLMGIGALAVTAVLGPGDNDAGVDRDGVAAAGVDARAEQPAPAQAEPEPAAQEPPVPQPTQQASPTPSLADYEERFSAVSGQVIETPCWSYEGPAQFVNNIWDEDAALCHGALELWGELHEGIVVPRGVGTIYGQIQVEAVRVTSSDPWTAGIDPDDPAALRAVIDTLADSYFAENGTVLSLHEETTLGGVPANVTRVESMAATTQTKAFITAFAPRSYTPGPDEVRLFVIAVVTPYANGDELIDQVVDTWRWR